MIQYIILTIVAVIIIINVIIVSTDKNLIKFIDWFFGRSKFPEFSIVELEGNDKIFVYKVYEKGPKRGIIELIKIKEIKNETDS